MLMKKLVMSQTHTSILIYIGQYCASTLHQKEQRILHAQISPCQFTGPDGQACSKEATFQYANNPNYKKYCAEHTLEGMVETSLCAVSSQPNAVETDDSDGEMENFEFC